ncbi:MAG: murein biosynthesis integral membrane protein MurJ, partial [Parachlamydiaceae bacterium]
PFLLGMIGVGAAQINSALDAVFANFAESSGPAYLWYAIRLQQLPLALFGIALSGALLPPLTRSIVAEDVSKSHLLLSEAIKRSLFLIVPVTALIFLVGRLSIDFLYGYGDFSAKSIDGTKNCLFGYGLGLIPMTLVLVLAPLFYAKQHYRIPSICSVASVVINMGLNALFVLVFNWGAFSIALGTSFSAWINMGLLVAFMDKSMQKVVWASIGQSLKSIGGALILASLATYFASDWFVLTGSFAIKGVSLLSLVLIFSASLLIGYSSFSALRRLCNSKKIPFTS